MPRKTGMVAALILLLAASPVFGESAKPAELTGLIHAEKPYGEGTYTYLLLTVYDVSLWTDAPAWSMDAPFALSLKYRMRFTSQQIVQRSIDEMQQQNPSTAAKQDADKVALSQVIPAVHAGDVITDVYTPGKGSVIYYNGHETGRLRDDDLARRFLGIWLSEKTSAPELRDALIKPGKP